MQCTEQRAVPFQVWSGPLDTGGSVRAGAGWQQLVDRTLERTLYHLLGPHAPLDVLLESAQLEAAASWPLYHPDEPVCVWAQRIAADVARRHLERPEMYPTQPRARERPGGLREVLVRLHARIAELRPEERFTFALLELDGRSVSEVAAVLRVPPSTVHQRAQRVRRHLSFAARRDRLLTRYLCIAARVRALASRLSQGVLGSPHP